MTEEAIFSCARDKVIPEERAAYLDRACAHDPGLRVRIEALLRAHEAPLDLLEAAAASGGMNTDPGATAVPAIPDWSSVLSITEGPGSRIGPYKLLQQIGEGGMGTVFMAEQESPSAAKSPSRSSSPAWTRPRSSPASRPSARRWR